MADEKIIINKHYSDPSAITSDVFSKKRIINKGGISGNTELLREGEIVLCNDTDEPGLYVYTESASTENPGKVINITSGEHIKVSTAYTEYSGTDVTILSTDSVADAFGKVVKQIKLVPTASTSEIKETTVETHTETFTGLDGKEHAPGTYLVMKFQTEGGILYTYNNISGLLDNTWDGTQEEYEALGEYDAKKTYYIHE